MTNAEKLKYLWQHPIDWIETFLRIPDKEGKIVQFKLNPMQKEFILTMSDYSEILKARQGGMSVAIAGYAIYIAVTQPNTSSLLLSHTDESTRNVFNKLKIIYNTIPDFIRPKLMRNNRAELMLDNGSIISCHTLGKRDVGRGSSLSVVHLSEFAFVGEQAKKQLLSLEQALVPSGKLIIESTANGIGNYFHELYYKAKNNENSYKAYFYNYLDTACMFTEDHKKAQKIWKARHRKYFDIDDLTEDEQELYSKWKDKGMTLDILCWRRLKISNSSEEEFNQEFPLTDILAFISSGSSVFSGEKLEERVKYLKEPLKKNEIIDLPSSLQWHYGRSFFMWENVKPGMKYYIGVDVAEGLGNDSDYSIIEVINSDGEQVSEFNSNKIAPHDFSEIVNCIGHYFNYGMLIVEKASAGHSVIDKVRHEYGYLNMYKTRIYDERGKKKRKVGFETNNKTKPIAVSDFREMFDKNLICINSKGLIEEMKAFSAIDGKLQASTGHDDKVMAFCFCIVGLKSGIWYV